MNVKFLCSVLLGLMVSSEATDQKLFVAVVASYNNAQWYERNLSSIFDQNYDNFYVLYTDDCSTDGTADSVQAWIDSHGVAEKITLIRNSERKGAMENQWNMINMLPDGAVVCIVDGDDFLAGPHVFSHLNSVYADANVWLTYGQFSIFPDGGIGWCQVIPERFRATGAFRDYHHNLSHLRTFYAGLFKLIDTKDLMIDGKFLQMCADNGAMFPMAEMGPSHIRFIPEVLLVWNGANRINDHKIDKTLQRDLDQKIRSWPRYKQIETPHNDNQEVSIEQIRKNIALKV